MDKNCAPLDGNALYNYGLHGSELPTRFNFIQITITLYTACYHSSTYYPAHFSRPLLRTEEWTLHLRLHPLINGCISASLGVIRRDESSIRHLSNRSTNDVSCLVSSSLSLEADGISRERMSFVGLAMCTFRMTS